MSSDPPIDNADPVVEYETLLASCLDDMSQQVANPTVAFRQRITGEAAVVIREQRAEVERLQAIVNKLPKTADGVPLHHGDIVHWWEDESVQWAYFRFIGRDGFEVENQYGNFSWPHNDFCYSTEKAAEASKDVAS